MPPAPSSTAQPSTTGQTPAAQPSAGAAAAEGQGRLSTQVPVNRRRQCPEVQNTGGSERGGQVSNGGQPANTPAGGGRRATPQPRGGEPAPARGARGGPATSRAKDPNPAATPRSGTSSGSAQTQTPAPTPRRGNHHPPPIAVNPPPGPIRGSAAPFPRCRLPSNGGKARLKQLAEDQAAIKRLLAEYADA